MTEKSLYAVSPHPDGASQVPTTATVDVARFLMIVRRYRTFIVTFVALCTFASGVIAFVLPNEYASTVNAVPPKRPQTGMESVLGGISSALRDFGLMRLGTPRSGTAAGYDFMVILGSQSLLDSLIRRFDLVRAYDITDAKSHDSAMAMAREELLDRYEIEFEGAGNYRITILDRDRYRAAAMANAVVEIANNIAQDLDRRESEVLLSTVQSRLEGLVQRMNVAADSLTAVSGKSLMFAPLEQAQAAAKALAEVKSQLAMQEIVLEVLQQRYGEEDPATRQQQSIVETLRQKLSDMEQQPGFVGNFPLRQAPRAAYDYLRYYTDLEALMKIKAAMLPALEEIRQSLGRYTPALYVVDPAVPAYKKAKPMRSVIIGTTFVSSVIVAVVLAIALENWRTVRRYLDASSSSSSQ